MNKIQNSNEGKNRYHNWYMGSSISALICGILTFLFSFIPCFGAIFSGTMASFGIPFIIIAFIISYQFNHSKGIVIAATIFTFLGLAITFFQFFYIGSEVIKYNDQIQQELERKNDTLQ